MLERRIPPPNKDLVTEIDWEAYMDEVKSFIYGERDYMLMEGGTGPLVYVHCACSSRFIGVMIEHVDFGIHGLALTHTMR